MSLSIASKQHLFFHTNLQIINLKSYSNIGRMVLSIWWANYSTTKSNKLVNSSWRRSNRSQKYPNPTSKKFSKNKLFSSQLNQNLSPRRNATIKTCYWLGAICIVFLNVKEGSTTIDKNVQQYALECEKHCIICILDCMLYTTSLHGKVVELVINYIDTSGSEEEYIKRRMKYRWGATLTEENQSTCFVSNDILAVWNLDVRRQNFKQSIQRSC